MYNLILSGKKGVKTLLFSFAVIAAVSLFNMLFAHYGTDVLFKIRDTEFTLESLFYGFNQGMVVAASLIWFTALGRSLDSEKIIYLFRFAPKSALIFSMVLGFIPRFLKKLSDIKEAQEALCGGKQPRGIKAKMNSAVNNFSALVSYSLESSIVTSDSMRARGYNPKAVRAGRYKYEAFDIVILIIILLLAAEVIIQKAIGNLAFVFEPDIYIKRLSIPAVICFTIFELIPSALDVWENLEWKISSVKE